MHTYIHAYVHIYPYICTCVHVYIRTYVASCHQPTNTSNTAPKKKTHRPWPRIVDPRTQVILGETMREALTPALTARRKLSQPLQSRPPVGLKPWHQRALILGALLLAPSPRAPIFEVRAGNHMRSLRLFLHRQNPPLFHVITPERLRDFVHFCLGFRRAL